MEVGNKNNENGMDLSRFGLGPEATGTRRNSGGFIDLGNEYDYAAGGHQASGANELFVEEQVLY